MYKFYNKLLCLLQDDYKRPQRWNKQVPSEYDDGGTKVGDNNM